MFTGDQHSLEANYGTTAELYPRDIGAWILEETSDGLKACYQIVALDAPDIFYAFPLIELLREASNRQVVTLPVCAVGTPLFADMLGPRKLTADLFSRVPTIMRRTARSSAGCTDGISPRISAWQLRRYTGCSALIKQHEGFRRLHLVSQPTKALQRVCR